MNMVEINGVKVERIPLHFQLGDNLIDGAIVRPMSFQNFADYIGEAQGMTVPSTFESRLRRVRLSKQISYYINGTVMPIAPLDVLRLPIPDARLLLSKIDDNEGPSGKIIRDGDGIEKAIVYELGTPISMGAGKEPIRELEFQASTYGDVEDVMAAADAIHQTAKLIEIVAKPLGTTLSSLPSWAASAISVSDGIMISRDILPRFLGSLTE